MQLPLPKKSTDKLFEKFGRNLKKNLPKAPRIKKKSDISKEKSGMMEKYFHLFQLAAPKCFSGESKLKVG